MRESAMEECGLLLGGRGKTYHRILSAEQPAAGGERGYFTLTVELRGKKEPAANARCTSQ